MPMMTAAVSAAPLPVSRVASVTRVLRSFSTSPATGERGLVKPGDRRRAWQELDVPVNPENPKIVTHELTDPNTSYAYTVGPQVVGAGGNIRRIIADSACDDTSVNHAIRAERPAKCR
ncbi:MAG: hypothetical protein AB8B85_15260 [Paracoccaceae bacterium]